MRIQRAIISVSDKTGIVDFAMALHEVGIELLSTGGTAQVLQAAQIPVTQIADFTDYPEMMDGRLKTLHPKVFGGLLARTPEDDAVRETHDIPLIDLVIVNLYPFAATIAREGIEQPEAISQIDVGGPSMLRAGAKNFSRVTVVVDPSDYSRVLQEIVKYGNTEIATRLSLAQKTFAHTAQYDQTISDYFMQQLPEVGTSTIFPKHLRLQWRRQQLLRYGENPQQQAAFYVTEETTQHWQQTLLQGKPCSYNNLMDADTALRSVQSFPEPACVIVKHANPCGAAIADNILHAYEKAFNTDPTSAFGGVIALNRTLSEALAETILQQQFVELILAPAIDAAALVVLQNKPNIRVFAYGDNLVIDRWEYRSINGGLLVQSVDITANTRTVKTVSQKTPTEQTMIDAQFAWQIVQWVKSNAIVIARSQATLGIGAGQASRVQSVQIAIDKALANGFNCQNAVLASDAFFPFADSIALAAKHGIRTIIQPGGSVRDAEVIAAANQYGITLLFTETRHFRH